MHSGGKNAKENRKSDRRTFIPHKLDFTVHAPNHCAKFHENRIKIATVGATTGTLTD